jgi:hypothetical protein
MPSRSKISTTCPGTAKHIGSSFVGTAGHSSADLPDGAGDLTEDVRVTSHPTLVRRSLVAAAVLALTAGLTAVLVASLSGGGPGGPARTSGYDVPPVGHVFVINIENKGFVRTWGSESKAPYLAKTLRAKGVLLSQYYGTAHNSQGNYIAQVSGQGVNPDMQTDCKTFATFRRTGTQAPGQAVGTTGCVFPTGVPTLMGQLDAHDLTWRGYLEGMGTACKHPEVGRTDPWQRASSSNEYATKHNPFVYFHSVIDRPRYCAGHVRPLKDLTADLADIARTRNLTYITPDLCHDGHDSPCANGEPGGLASVNTWMRTWVPRILASPAFKKDGLLLITADESDSAKADARACCGDGATPNAAKPGITGPGGGRIGLLAISRWTRPGSTSTNGYNHYALLGSLEEIWALPKIGYAATPGRRTFGLDVYNSNWQG